MASFFPPVFAGDGSINWTVLWFLGFVLLWQTICCVIYYMLYLRQRIRLETSRLSSHKEKLNQYLNTQSSNNDHPPLPYGHTLDAHSINTESMEYQQLLEQYTFYEMLMYKLNKICCSCKCCKKISNCITLRKYNNSNDSKNNMNNIDEKYKSTLQRYNLWIWAHILRILFLINALCDTFIQLTTQSVSEDGEYIFFNETLLFHWNCRLNGVLRMMSVANSLMICSLFNWSKAASIFTSILGNTHYGDKKSTKYIMKYGFIYIIIVNPLLCIIGLYEFLWKTKMNEIQLIMNNDYYCIITFDWYLFTLYLIHDIVVNIFLTILFVQPLYQALKRHRYVSSPYHFNCSPDINTKNNMIYSSLDTDQRNQSGANISIGYDKDAMYDRLISAIIRNGFAGIGTLIISTGYFMAFMYATYYIKNDETHLWAKGYILSGNITKYVLTYIFMTLTYRDWDYMFHPLCCYYCSSYIQKLKCKINICCCCCRNKDYNDVNRSNMHYRDSLII